MPSPLFQRPEPLVPQRAIHFDLKGLPPTPERFERLLDIVAAARYTHLLMEWEDTFPWRCDRRFRGETCYDEATIQALCEGAEARGLQVIPLVQCLGHMETPLAIDDYAHLREVPDRIDCLNPLADGAGELIAEMIADVLRLIPSPAYFHLGGDEAWLLGRHPRTRAYIEEHGKAALYLQHVEPLIRQVQAQGCRPILWHDMMMEWPEDQLRSLGADADLMVWGYSGTPEATTHHHRREVIERMAAAEVPLWGAGAFKAGPGLEHQLPEAEPRLENMAGWADAAESFELVGVCATGWSRNATPTHQYSPIDGCLDLVLLTGAILHDGSDAADRQEAAEALLEELGEAARFRTCREALRAFDAACTNAWTNIRNVYQHTGHLASDPQRCRGGMDRCMYDWLGGPMADAEAAGKAVQASLEGCMEERWGERLVEARLQALRQARRGLGEEWQRWYG